MIPLWLRRIATGRAVAIALLAWLSCSAILLNRGPYPQLKASILELAEEDFTSTASEARSKLVQLGEKGRERYRQYQQLDSANAVIAAIAATLLMTYALSRLVHETSPVGLLIYLPAVAGVCELIENSMLGAAAAQYPETSSTALRIAGVATRLKLLLGVLVPPILAFCYAKLGLRVWRARRRATIADRS